MANEVAGIDIQVQLDAYRREMAKIPDIGAKEARALTSQLSREIKKAERAATRAARNQERAFGKLQSTLIKTELSLELVKKAFDLTVRGIGATFERARELDKEMKGELNPALKQATKAANDLFNQGVKPLVPAITDLVDLVRDLSTAVMNSGALKEFSQGLSDVASGAVLAARELFGLNEENRQLIELRNLENGAIEAQATRIENLRFELRRLEGARVDAAQLMGLDSGGPSSEEQALQRRIDRQIEVLRKLRGEINRDRGRRAEQSIRTPEADPETKAIEHRTLALADYRKQERDYYIRRADRRQKDSEEAIRAAEEVAKAQERAAEKALAAEQRAHDERRALHISLAQTAISTAETVAQAIVDGLESVLLANVREARRRRDIELGLAILRGELQAAAAFGTTLATYGATPQGFALAAAAAAAVGISSKAAAAAAHASSSERFHSGGPVQGSRASEVPAALLPGEFVVNRQGVAAAGRRALEDINAGRGGGGPSLVAVVVDHKVAGAMTAKAMQDPGSGLSQRLAGLAPVAGGYMPHG